MQTGPSNKKIYYFTSQQRKILMWYNDSVALSPDSFYLSTLSTAPWLHPKTLPACGTKIVCNSRHLIQEPTHSEKQRDDISVLPFFK